MAPDDCKKAPLKSASVMLTSMVTGVLLRELPLKVNLDSPGMSWMAGARIFMSFEFMPVCEIFSSRKEMLRRSATAIPWMAD
jgi:hypothetical protein